MYVRLCVPPSLPPFVIFHEAGRGPIIGRGVPGRARSCDKQSSSSRLVCSINTEPRTSRKQHHPQFSWSTFRKVCMLSKSQVTPVISSHISLGGVLSNVGPECLLQGKWVKPLVSIDLRPPYSRLTPPWAGDPLGETRPPGSSASQKPAARSTKDAELGLQMGEWRRWAGRTTQHQTQAHGPTDHQGYRFHGQTPALELPRWYIRNTTTE
ncbi:hypothetical protein EGW08_005914 [Elysia chlorotica]|uniref:Uncharacterized protein n=1 Tax=Elysia chlorotica TaxID=188477 RepID=A0A3S0ZUR7_ELYCH|nr:hypothetical protein EGW08_005914 [Elysia chlorotica]